jgi:hypothetical protein
MKPMLAKLLHHPAGWLVVALLSSLAARAPFMHYTVLDWDESTYILMGDSLLRGNLPYIEMSDNKPPGVMYVFALIQGSLGKSIESIRLGGMLIVALSAWAVALFTRRAFPGQAWPVVSAAVMPWMVTLVPRVGSVYTEHVAILFLCPVLVLLSRERHTPTSGWLMGLSMALAVLVRTNLAYPALVLGASMFFLPLGVGVRRPIFLGWFAAGAIFPVAILLVLYRSHLPLFFQSVIMAPLVYSEGSGLFSQLWWSNFIGLVRRGLSLPYLPGFLGGIIGLVVWLRERSTVAFRKLPLVALGVGGLATAAGVAAGGASLDHYMIQLVPFVVPLIAVAMHGLSRWHPLAACFAGGLLLVSWGATWGNAVQRPFPGPRSPEFARHDYVREMVDYLDQHGARGEVLYFLHGHIGYWLLDAVPPTRIAHPSNLTKIELSRALEHPDWSPEREIDHVFRQHPRFVILPGPVWYLDDYPEVKEHIESYLVESYERVTTIGWYRIYIRHAEGHED